MAACLTEATGTTFSPQCGRRTRRSTGAAPWSARAGECARKDSAAGLYKPIWEYDAKTLAWDLGAHLAYGAGTGTAFGLLTRNT